MRISDWSSDVCSSDLYRSLFNPGQRRFAQPLLAYAAQSNSGASETIFMNFSDSRSRVTGPKMRVPIGSFLLLSNTAELPSKRISEPSERTSVGQGKSVSVRVELGGGLHMTKKKQK